MTRVLYLFMFLMLWGTASAQLIINVENSRIQSDTTGWAGSLGTSFSLVKNVQQVLSINANMHLQYKDKKNLYLILANYNLLKGNQQELSNNMFYHFRYNRTLSKAVRWEAFTQWQQNNITNIDVRFLVGTGPRFKIHESSTLKFYGASLAMYEYERDKKPPVVHKDMRSDNYLTFTYTPNTFIVLTSTTFYQPLYRYIKDFRVLNQEAIDIKATKHFSITISFDYLYDAFPAAGTPSINYTINNGFNYTF